MGEEGDKPFAEPSKEEMPQGYWRTGVGCRIYSRMEIAGVLMRSKHNKLLPKRPWQTGIKIIERFLNYSTKYKVLGFTSISQKMFQQRHFKCQHLQIFTAEWLAQLRVWPWESKGSFVIRKGNNDGKHVGKYKQEIILNGGKCISYSLSNQIQQNLVLIWLALSVWNFHAETCSTLHSNTEPTDF